jgi:hypothetical protein
MRATVQLRAMVIKLKAGQKIQVSIFAITFVELSGRIFVLHAIKPIAMQRNSVSMGFKVAKNVVSI